MRINIRLIVSNMLLALVLSLIINFSIFLFRLYGPPPGPGIWKSIQQGWFITYQVFYFFALAFALLTISTRSLTERNKNKDFAIRVIVCSLITTLVYFLGLRPVRDGHFEIILNARHMLDPQHFLKCSFTLIVCLLYGRIHQLVYDKQRMRLEYEVLKNENLQTTYNTLVNQINPHFFFNSLNSLSMLVREKYNDKAVIYIDKMSETFRYIISNGQAGWTTLDEELTFVDSFRYLLEVRYEGKLFFDMAIDDQARKCLLPTFSLQPLLENAVKHNVITRSAPLTINIHACDGKVTVSNVIKAKKDVQSHGTGLDNLSKRFILLTGQDIKVTESAGIFTVELPLTEPGDENSNN